jgi:hypothetical protein
MSMRQISCPSWVELSDDEVTTLAVLPGSAHEVARRVWCELEAGHRDRHAGLGQYSFDGVKSAWWWVWWPVTGHEISVAEPCPAGRQDGDSSDDDPDGPEPCLLPAEHAGRHSFDFEDQGSGAAG